METIKFAYKSPDGTGACKSEEDREKEISAFLDTVKWIHPGRFISRRGDPASVEAVVVLRHPHGAALPKHLSSWLQKKLPKLFGGSLCSLDSEFKWSAYSVRSKGELVCYYAVDDARALQRQGYNIQVVLPKVERLHRIALPSPVGVVWPEPEAFDRFIRKHSYIARFTLSH